MSKQLKRKLGIIFLCFFMVKTGFSQVRMWQEQVTIPTLKIGTPAPHPTFKRNIDMLADDDQIYPYLYNSKILNAYEDKSYIGCYLENEYIKVFITPELGGKLYGAKDKTNDYNFFYWQPTVKPALISLTGPWVSGGIEWCFPSGHRQTTYAQIGHRLVENKDGSKTIWVGETEWVHGLRWAVGVTIYPGKSVIEAKVRLMNPTALPQSQYMWAIAATHANENYQLIYPTEYMTNHNKFEYTSWPMNGGKDLSWWKNIPNANSYFANNIGSFFGGFDHGKNAGTVFTGNKHIIVGKKFWTWGTSPFGRMWDWILSDGGGPYAEPQAGGYTDNQPDFHWMNPGEVKSYSHFFFPVKEIGGFKEANENGALNLEFAKGVVKIGAYSTSEVKNAVVRLTYKGTTVFERITDIDPSKPVVGISTAAHKDLYNYKLVLLDAKENEILSYSPEVEIATEKPKASIAYEDPSLFKSVDELWHIGDFLYKNRDKNTAYKFFVEILEKDSLNVIANLSMAQMEIEKGAYEIALKYVNSAAERAWDDGNLFYLKGVANEGLGNIEEAYSAYYRVTHFQAYLSQSYERIAKIDLKNQNPKLALEHLEKALTQNMESPQLWAAKSVVFRLLGQYENSAKAIEKVLEFDPINFWALNEKKLIADAKKLKSDTTEKLVTDLLLNDTQYYIELAIFYMDVGLYKDGLTVLKRAETISKEIALVQYYKGFCYDQMGDKENAVKEFKEGKKSSVENVFPFRRKSIEIFSKALVYDKNDEKSYYYLGLIYNGLNNGEKAFEYFKKSNQLNPENGMTLRNLGYLKGGFNGVTPNLKEARTYYEKAFKVRPADDLILMEFDNIKMSLGEDPKARLKFLKKHIKVVEKRDDLLSGMLDLMVAFGEYKTPIHFYETHMFNNREGKYSIHNSYMNAYIGMAKTAKSSKNALAFYQKATLYPKNLKVKPRAPNLRGFLYYPMALLFEKTGDSEKAIEHLNITKNEHTELPTLVNYYQSLAIEKTEKNNPLAKQLLVDLEKEAQALIKGKSEGYFRKEADFRKALGHYYLAVLHKENKRAEKSKIALEKAKSIYSFIERDAIIWAQIVFAGASQ